MPVPWTPRQGSLAKPAWGVYRRAAIRLSATNLALPVSWVELGALALLYSAAGGRLLKLAQRAK
jgi:hypothetical protein